MNTVRVLINTNWHEIRMNESELEDLIQKANTHLHLLQKVRIEDWDFYFKPCEVKALEVIGEDL